MTGTVGWLIGYTDEPKDDLALCADHTARAVLIVCTAVIVAVLAFAAGRLSAPDTTCFEDQVIVWSGHDHSVCLDVDDFTALERAVR